MSADRELRAQVTVNATAGAVWRALTEFRHLASASPEVLAMLPLQPGGLRPRQWYLGINRRKFAVWPSRNVIVDVEPGRTLSWDTRTSGARWTFELTPEGETTTLTQRRQVPNRLTRLGSAFAAVALGGSSQHTDELEHDMQSTLEQLATVIEREDS